MRSVPVAAAIADPGVPLPSPQRRGPGGAAPLHGGVAPRPASPGIEAAAFTRFALAEAATVAGLLAVLATAFVV